MNALREGDVDVPDVRLHYIDWGGNGAPIVLLHATGLLGQIYRPIAEALTAVGHVFSYDQRGHGDSGKANPAKYDWALTASDLENFIRVMKLENVRGFGHSGCNGDRCGRQPVSGASHARRAGRTGVVPNAGIAGVRMA
jgi:pimeloyl-ACP methyl ester carboxylesterase